MPEWLQRLLRKPVPNGHEPSLEELRHVLIEITAHMERIDMTLRPQIGVGEGG